MPRIHISRLFFLATLLLLVLVIPAKQFRGQDTSSGFQLEQSDEQQIPGSRDDLEDRPPDPISRYQEHLNATLKTPFWTRVCLRPSVSSNYVEPSADGHSLSLQTSLCEESAQFEIYDLNGGSLDQSDVIFIRTGYDRFWSAQPRPSNRLEANRLAPLEWERFTVRLLGAPQPTSDVSLDGSMIALEGFHGRFVTANPDSAVLTMEPGLPSGANDRQKFVVSVLTKDETPARLFGWSYAGAFPRPARCVQWREPWQPAEHTWHDNHLCHTTPHDIRWSSEGMIPGMRCTLIGELADRLWRDNYLCINLSAPIGFLWSSSGSIPGQECIKIDEPSDPDTWADNYLCITAVPPGVETAAEARTLIENDCAAGEPLAFDVSLEEKYPRPETADPTLVLLPNRRSYTTNTDRCPCLDEECSETTIQYRTNFIPLTTGTSWTGALRVKKQGDDAWTKYFPVPPGGTEVCLPEGEYAFRLRIKNLDDGRCYGSDKTESLDAFVIALIGDSYAAGEGTPAGRFEPTYLRQLDSPEVRHLRRVLEEVYPVDEKSWKQLLFGLAAAPIWARADPGPPPISLSSERGYGGIKIAIFDFERMSKEEAANFKAHRSPFAPASQLAMAIEEASNTSNVTFVNLAVSGATIRRGVREPSCVPETSRSAGQICDRFEETQIDGLRRLLRDRSIDALFVGFGGNDAGFARVAKMLVVREENLRQVIRTGLNYPSSDEIKQVIKHGNWTLLDPDENPIAGLDGLEAEYAALDAALFFLSNDAPIDQVFLMGYPNPVRKVPIEKSATDDGYCEFFRNVARFDNQFAKFYERRWWGELEVDPAEARFAEEHFLFPLGEKMNSAAAKYRWSYVDRTGGDYHTRTICGDRPYEFDVAGGYQPTLPPADLEGGGFRLGLEAYAISSSTSKNFSDRVGLLHPNEMTYQRMALDLADHLLAAGTEMPVPRVVVRGPGAIEFTDNRPLDQNVPQPTAVELHVENRGNVNLNDYQLILDGYSVVSRPKFDPIPPGDTRSLRWEIDPPKCYTRGDQTTQGTVQLSGGVIQTERVAFSVLCRDVCRGNPLCP